MKELKKTSKVTFGNILRVIPALIWMYLIYWFSDKPAVQSQVQSEGLSLQIIKTVAKYVYIPEESQPELALSIEGYVREVAHFIEYAILFILVYFAVKAFFDESKKAIIISLAFCFLFACSDEIHQLFVPGRA
ncbi:MAG: VanZ family protein, partial [Lachnospiraceae bacterium]|nr:VanZ family protein [Lachnospiraceae bacterium]